MTSPGASTPADASTRGTITVTALNVGMNTQNSFRREQDRMLRELADRIIKWLEPGAAAVALNEIHPEIAEKLKSELRGRHASMDIKIATSNASSLLWCVPR